MCSVSISEQEVSQIDTVTVTIVSTIVTGPVKISALLVIDVADDRDNMYNVET
jgi:hypothetical protein